MLSRALPYDPRWAAKLLHRDLRAIKAKAADKFKARFGRSKSTSPSSPEAIDVAIVEPEAPQVSKSPAPTPSTAESSAFYVTLEGHLRTLWASRNRNAAPEDLWYFRGSWLVLWMALQAWPGCTSYGIFDVPKAVEMVLVDEVVRLFGGAKTSRMSHRDNKMADEPFLRLPVRPRFDFLFGNGVPGVYVNTKATPAHLWCGILRGAMDASMTVEIAEELLAFILPDVHVPKMIAAIGDPAVQFRGEENLRHALRDALFPNYNTISSSPLR